MKSARFLLLVSLLAFLGGIAGNTRFNGVEFSENAVFQKFIWKQD